MMTVFLSSSKEYFEKTCKSVTKRNCKGGTVNEEVYFVNYHFVYGYQSICSECIFARNVKGFC